MHPSSSHQAHLQMSLVTSVSAFAQHGHHPNFHHGPQIHHPQALSFPPIVHPAHHHHHHHHLLPPPRLDHKLASAFELPNPSNEFYKNSHMHPPLATIPPPSIPSLPNPAIIHHPSTIPPPPPVSIVTPLPHINQNHTLTTHHQRFHHSPPSPAHTIKSTTSTIEPSHDSAESPPLVVDNVASPISVSSSSNNLNTTISMSINNANKSNGNNNNNNNENALSSTINGTIRPPAVSNSTQHNGLLDILMNPEKCQVNNVD